MIDISPPTRQVAFFIDGDNLSGQSWSLLIEKAREFGYVAIARLYMDFQSLSDGGFAARSVGFEPVHVLGKRTSSGFKSMVDVALATDSISVLYENPNITTIILGTGDADFIPVIRHWKRRGKMVVVMSNEAKLSTELRLVADHLVTFGGRKKAEPARPAPVPLPPLKLRQAVLELVGSTRLTDRETDQPLIRVDWLLEQLHKAHPEAAGALPDEAQMMKLLAEIPELVPIDGKGRSFLVGLPEVEDEPEPAPASSADKMTDEQILDLFGELCRDALPPDGSWMPAPHTLNEGKRLLEDGAGLELPASRPTGWFRRLMEETPGVEVRHTHQGHMELRLVP